MKTHSQLALANLIIITLLLTACQAQKFTTANLPDKQLIFGSGGGFTGKVTQYILLENGQVFTSDGPDSENKELKIIDKKTALKLFDEAEKLHLEDRDFNHPGNMYYFLEFKRDATPEKVTWGIPSESTPQDLLDFYQRLQTAIQ